MASAKGHKTLKHVHIVDFKYRNIQLWHVQYVHVQSQVRGGEG